LIEEFAELETTGKSDDSRPVGDRVRDTFGS
jgi:hypothetical protein